MLLHASSSSKMIFFLVHHYNVVTIDCCSINFNRAFNFRICFIDTFTMLFSFLTVFWCPQKFRTCELSRWFTMETCCWQAMWCIVCWVNFSWYISPLLHFTIYCQTNMFHKSSQFSTLSLTNLPLLLTVLLQPVLDKASIQTSLV